MKYFLSSLILPFVAFLSCAQENDSITESGVIQSESYVPIACFDSTLYIEKMEEIYYHELVNLIRENELDYNKDLAIDGVEFYNNISMFRLNQQFEKVCADETKLNLSTLYTSDYEKLPRYTIVSDYVFNYYDPRFDRVNYSLFDNDENIRYKSFSSLELLLSAINTGDEFIARSAVRGQSDLDAYLDNQLSRLRRKELRKEMRGTGGGSNAGWVIGGLLGAWALVAIFDGD